MLNLLSYLNYNQVWVAKKTYLWGDDLCLYSECFYLFFFRGEISLVDYYPKKGAVTCPKDSFWNFFPKVALFRGELFFDIATFRPLVLAFASIWPDL